MIVLNSPARGLSRRAEGRAAGRAAVRCSGMVLAAVTLMMSAGCMTGRANPDNQGAAKPASIETRRETLAKQGRDSPPQRAPSTTAISQGSGEVPPQILAIFRDDLARRALVKQDAITVVSATEQQWPDGAMGCAQPGQMYTQMIVPGYRVVLQAAGNRYAYHSDRRGNFIVCSNGLSFPPVKEQGKDPAPVK